MCPASAVTDVIDQDGLFTQPSATTRAARASACGFSEVVAGFEIATFTINGAGSSVAAVNALFSTPQAALRALPENRLTTSISRARVAAT
jgi:hypothetical protein